MPRRAWAPAWNGIPATSFSGGSGTESDPYLISNGGELAYLAQKVNESNSTSNPYRGAWYRLTADIDLGNQEWTPIGWNASAPYYFCGTFIGGGHTISHLKISGNVNYAGLFGSLANASICNLTLRDSSIVSSGYHVGAFVGNTGASPETLCNLHVVDTTVEGKYAVGGIVGYASAGSGYTITLCCSSVQGATITGTQYGVGGVVGQAGGPGGTANISRSWCAASQVSSTSYGGAGGIVGMVANNSTTSVGQVVHIADCYSTADVRVGTPVAGSNVYDAAGGIVGYARSAHLTVDRCYSTGIITAGRCMAKNSLTYAAGICGYSIGGTYTNCYHAGQLATANTNTSYKSTLSGIRCNSGSVNYCYYTSDCFPANSKYFTKSTSGTEIADVAAIVTRISQDAAWTGTGYWKLEDGALPTLTGCINPEGTCTCGCGCHCVPSEPDEPVIPEDALLLCDGVTGEVLKILNQADYISGRNDLLAGSLAYEGTDFTVNGTRKTAGDAQYTFAGWFYTPCGSKARSRNGLDGGKQCRRNGPVPKRQGSEPADLCLLDRRRVFPSTDRLLDRRQLRTGGLHQCHSTG